MLSRRPGLLAALVGLLVFEAMIVWVMAPFVQFGVWQMLATAVAGAVFLVAQLRFVLARRSPLPLLWALLAASTLSRGLVQQFGGNWSWGLLPTYLVPLGFVLIAFADHALTRSRLIVGLALITFARGYFALWYFASGATTVALANTFATLGLVTAIVLLAVSEEQWMAAPA
jgi:hypothetical protein